MRLAEEEAEVAVRAERAFEDLCRRFGGRRPDFLITVTGALDGFYIKHKDLLKKQLLKAVESTDAWIMADVKLNSFIMSVFNHCRRGFDKSNIKWHEEVTKRKSSSDFRESNSRVKNEDKIETKSPHCIIFDNTQRVILQGIERYLASNASANKKSDSGTLKIPVVRIIIGGVDVHIEEVTDALENNIPVVIAKGSGGAADCLAKVVLLGRSAETLDATKDVTTRSRFSESLVSGKIDKNKVYIHSLEDKDTSFDEVIQNAIFDILKKNHGIKRQLNAVRNWNRLDIFEQDILAENDPKKLETELSDMFATTFENNNSDFVTILVDIISDIIIKKYSKLKYMQKLYHKCLTSTSKGNAGKLVLRSCKTMHPKNKDLYEKGVRENHSSMKYEEYMKGVQDFINQFCGDKSLDFYPDKREGNVNEESIMFQMFVCCILTNHKEMAMIFWRRCKNNVSAALFASNVLKRLSNRAFKGHFLELHESCMRNADFFEELACRVITELFDINSSHASGLLETIVVRYNISPLEMAYRCHRMKFMASTPCQVTLSQRWMGSIKPHISSWRVAIGVLFPIMIVPKFRLIEMEKTQEDVTKEPSGMLKEAAERIYNFYSPPVTTFVVHVIFYMAFLTIFSIFVLSYLHPTSEKEPSVLEYVTWVLVVSLLIEEFLQLNHKSNKDMKTKDKIAAYITDVWNTFDMAAVVSFFVAIILRYTLDNENFFYARAVYVVSLAMFILRTLQFFYISRRIGPKVIMLEKLFADLIFFFSIFAIFVFSFGIVYQVILFPNTPPSWQLFKKILYIPYWQLYGELFIDEIEGEKPTDCTKNPALYRNDTAERCPESRSLNTAMLAIYLILTNVILMNTLVAMFTFTIQMVQDKSEMFWKHHRYTLIREYYERPMFPFPILVHIWRLIRYFSNKCNTKPLSPTPKYNASERMAVDCYFDEPTKARSRYALKDWVLEENTGPSLATDSSGHQLTRFEDLQNELKKKQDTLQRDLLKSMQEIKKAVEVDKNLFDNLNNWIENHDKIIVDKIVEKLKTQESIVVVHPAGPSSTEWKKTRIPKHKEDDPEQS